MKADGPVRRVLCFRTIGASEFFATRWKSAVGTWLALGVLTSICGVINVSAEEGWIPDGRPDWTSSQFETAGGITYFRHTALVQGCRRVAAESPVGRSGTNLSQTISQERWTGACLCDWINPCYHTETHVSVLGALPPGDYGLWITYVDLYPDPGPGPGTGSWVTFTWGSVPVSDDRTLSGWVDADSATFKLAVAGVSNVTYVIEASSDFTNWTTVTTKTNGPFVWSEPLQPQATSCFYRTQIIGN